MELPEALAFLEIETLPSILSIYKFFLGLLSLFNDNSKYYKPSFEIKGEYVLFTLFVSFHLNTMVATSKIINFHLVLRWVEMRHQRYFHQYVAVLSRRTYTRVN